MREYSIRKEVQFLDIEKLYLYGKISIDKIPNVSKNWLMIIKWADIPDEEINPDKLTLDWQENPYKVISEVGVQCIEFFTLDDKIENEMKGNTLGHPKRVRWKKNVLLHRHLLNEVISNANIDILEREIIYTKKEVNRSIAEYRPEE